MMRASILALLVAMAAAKIVPLRLEAADVQVLGWNNLGMHCMDSDYSVFSILPPYNTTQAQLIVGGRARQGWDGYSVTYEAIADPDESFNSTAIGKGNFYNSPETFTAPLGARRVWSAGLCPARPIHRRPCSSNRPITRSRGQHLRELVAGGGIPLSPYDDADHYNPYPLMQFVARDASDQPLAHNDIVLPISDESIACCHASGTGQRPVPPPAGFGMALQEGLPAEYSAVARRTAIRQFQTCIPPRSPRVDSTPVCIAAWWPTVNRFCAPRATRRKRPARPATELFPN